MMNWKMWQKCVGKMGKKLPIFLFIFILLYVIGSLICYPMLTKRHALKQKEKYAEQAAKETVDRSASVRCLDDNTQALVYRLALIESAQQELIMTTFDMSDGESGQDLMAAMLQAADRGVRIRLMVDGINAWLKLEKSDLFGAFSTHPNIEIRFYNPIRLTKLWKLNYRMHDKYLIADDTAYILGGRNSNNLFLGAYRDTYNIDRDLYVLERTEKNASDVMQKKERNSLQDIKAYFEKIWVQPDQKIFRKKETEKTKEGLALLREHYKELQTAYPEAFSETETLLTQNLIRVDSIQFLHNPLYADEKVPVVYQRICQEMEQGETILIQTPYIICDKGMYQDLSELCRAGKQIEIITNAVESGANPWGCTDYLNERKSILKTGAGVYACMAGQSLHTKTVLIDDETSIVGSYNLDLRSTYLDTELMLLVKSKELNKQLRDQAAAYQQKSTYEKAGKPSRTGSLYEKKEMSGMQKVIYSILRILIRPIREVL